MKQRAFPLLIGRIAAALAGATDTLTADRSETIKHPRRCRTSLISTHCALFRKPLY
jgi:hypothetical protein